jgi:hypothetical protein
MSDELGYVGPKGTRAMPAQKPGKSKQDYSTPIAFLDAVKKRFGLTAFDFDLAATKANALIVSAAAIVTSGLTTPRRLGATPFRTTGAPWKEIFGSTPPTPTSPPGPRSAPPQPGTNPRKASGGRAQQRTAASSSSFRRPSAPTGSRATSSTSLLCFFSTLGCRSMVRIRTPKTSSSPCMA